MLRFPWRRKPFRFLCPYCGNQTFGARIGLARERYNRPPRITTISNRLVCTDCGFVSNYQDFIDQHRGWL